MNLYPNCISSKVLPYVYRLEHKVTGKVYIGSRTAKSVKTPSQLDFIEYRTSSKIVKPNFEEYNWYIVAEFFGNERWDDAYDLEQELIYLQWQESKEMSLNVRCYFNSKAKFNNTKEIKECPYCSFQDTELGLNRNINKHLDTCQYKIDKTNQKHINYNQSLILRWKDPVYKDKMTKSLQYSWDKLNEEEKENRRNKTRSICASIEYRENLSKSVKEKQWDSIKGKDRKEKLSIKMQGANNPSAKTYKITSVDGTITICKGSLSKVCKELDLSLTLMRSWVNKGKIKRTSVKDTSFFTFEQKRKVFGWEIEELK